MKIFLSFLIIFFGIFLNAEEVSSTYCVYVSPNGAGDFSGKDLNNAYPANLGLDSILKDYTNIYFDSGTYEVSRVFLIPEAAPSRCSFFGYRNSRHPESKTIFKVDSELKIEALLTIATKNIFRIENISFQGKVLELHNLELSHCSFDLYVTTFIGCDITHCQLSFKDSKQFHLVHMINSNLKKISLDVSAVVLFYLKNSFVKIDKTSANDGEILCSIVQSAALSFDQTFDSTLHSISFFNTDENTLQIRVDGKDQTDKYIKKSK